MACYSGPNPVTDDERVAIWKWAKENGIDRGDDYAKVHDSVNNYFFSGMAKPEWVDDILGGRKTPFRAVARDLWAKRYNRQAITQQAQMLSQRAALGPLGRAVMRLRWLPRSTAVFGHSIVFPVTHAGDLILNPQHWGTFTKGLIRTYRSAASSKYAAEAINQISRRPMSDLARESGLDYGPRSHAVGIMGGGGKTGFLGASARAWDALTLMRYELWEKQMKKYTNPDMDHAEKLEIGQQLAEWANHATGSGKGRFERFVGNAAFGPKLTQSKLNRLTSDPAQTIKTIAKWATGGEVTPGEKAVAMTRVKGAAAYLATSVGFLVANQAVLSALGSKQKINYTDPSKGDYMAFKTAGVDAYIPGMHTEIRTLAKLLNVAYQASTVMGKRGKEIQNPEKKGDTKMGELRDILGGYAMNKLEPGIQRATELAIGENYQGRPLPFSSSKGTEKKPKMSYGEYTSTLAPIPLEGPIGYVYDHLRHSGASAMDSNAIVKGLIIFGGGLPGFHVKEDFNATKE